MSRQFLNRLSSLLTSCSGGPGRDHALRTISIRCFSFNTNKKQEVRTSSKAYSVGLIGCGRVAGIHLKNILHHSHLSLKWVLEENADRVQEIRTQFRLDKSIPVFPYSKGKELLTDKSLDAVVVVSPTPTHAEYICDSLKQGKGVFTEKPVAESYSDIKTCYEMAEKYGRPLLSGFNRRFDSAFQDVKAAITNGSLGDLHVIKTTTRDSPKPSYTFLESADNSGCNIFADLVVHDIDMLVWLTNAQRPESIYVNCHINDPTLLKCGEPDTLVAIMKYPNGTLVTMDSSRDSIYGYDIRLEVFGSGGMAVAENPRESSTIIDGGSGGSVRRLFNSFPERFERAYERELEHFIDCLDGTTTPLITKEESLCVAEIIEKGIESFKMRQAVNF